MGESKLIQTIDYMIQNISADSPDDNMLGRQKAGSSALQLADQQK